MGKKLELSEREVNEILIEKLKHDDLVILNRVRLSPAEFDVLIFDRRTLELINIEIKKNRWERLFQQAQRGKLYCHYSIVMLPLHFKETVDLQTFTSDGIGVMFYEEVSGDIQLTYESPPQKSKSINRYFKKLLYEHINSHYEGVMYA